jgi:hypothetical protein
MSTTSRIEAAYWSLGGQRVVTVHNISGGLLNPALGYAVSCLGAFLGLRCVTRARAHAGSRPSEEEIRMDAQLKQTMEELRRKQADRAG